MKLQAEQEFDKQWKKERLEIVQRCARQPDTKAQQCQQQLSKLRSQMAGIERELELHKQVEVETLRNLDARMKLLEANRTPAEKQAYDAEIRRGQIAFSRIVPENHPNWRQ
jgi:hypothetical protein